MKEYKLFPDVRIMYGEGNSAPELVSGEVLEISYCSDGVSEYRCGQEHYYLTKGNYIAFRHSSESCRIAYSADHKGLSIFIDGNTHGGSVMELMGGTDALAEKLKDSGNMIVPADEDMLRLFNELYQICESMNEPKLRIRTAEVIMLAGGNISDSRHISADITEKVKPVGNFVGRHINSHFTISQLSGHFGVNPTTLKSAFKQTFGCSIYAYARNRKMFSAAEKLSSTEKKIIDIAAESGYSNASKFASAFRQVIGVTPRDYRRSSVCQTEHFSANLN